MLQFTKLATYGDMAGAEPPQEPAQAPESASPAVDELVQGARFGDLEDVVAALAQGASVNSQDEQGRTGVRNRLYLLGFVGTNILSADKIPSCSSSHGSCQWPSGNCALFD